MNEQAKFQEYLTRNIGYLTQLVLQAEPIPTQEVRLQALHSLSYALGAPAAWEFTRQLLFALAPKMEQAGHRSDWLPYLERAADLSEQLGDLASAAEFMLQRGMLHRLLSEFVLAKSQLAHSIALCKRIDAPRNQARALNELAWVEYLQNQTTAAAEYVQRALALLPVDDPERAMCYRVQGMIAIVQEQWVEAEALHRQALAIFEGQGDQRKSAWSLQNLAYALRGQGQVEEAIRYYEHAASLLKEQDDFYHWSVVQMNLGICYRYSGKHECALNHYVAAESIPQSLLDRFHLARLRVNSAISLMHLSQFSKAERAFEDGIQLLTELGAIAWRLNAMDGLAMTYIGWKKFEQAIAVLEQALSELPAVAGATNYAYLRNSLHQHLEEAQNGRHNQTC